MIFNWDQNNVDHLASTAESRLKSLIYASEGRCWNYEKYVCLQMEEHQILIGLKVFGHVGIDVRSRARQLIEGIKTKELDAVKMRVLLDALLCSNFTVCVSLYKDFIRQNDVEVSL